MVDHTQSYETAHGGRYINPFTDFGFKKIFGEEPNKDLLIDFLNELLREENYQIQDLTYKKTDRLGISDLDRNVVFDLYCESTNGDKFIVEMQKSKQTFFKDRTLFYSTFPIQEQAPKGPWNFQLKAVFAVGILDFVFEDDEKDLPAYHDHDKTVVSYVQLMNKKTHRVFYKKLNYIFVQMPNFKKTIDELETRRDQWLYLLKNLDSFDRIPDKLKEKIFTKVFNIAEYQNLSKADRDAYEESLKYYRDLKNSLDTAELDGYKRAQQELAPIIEAERQLKAEALELAERERLEKESALLQAQEFKQREEEARLKAEESKQREEEARLKAEESKQREEEARLKAEESKQREEEARIKIEESKQREEEARLKAEESKQREEEARLKIEESKQREEEARIKAEEATQQAVQSQQREESLRQSAALIHSQLQTIVRRQHALGHSHEQIAELLGMSAEEITKLLE